MANGGRDGDIPSRGGGGGESVRGGGERESMGAERQGRETFNREDQHRTLN